VVDFIDGELDVRRAIDVPADGKQKEAENRSRLASGAFEWVIKVIPKMSFCFWDLSKDSQLS
jgi:hypothetical protein